MPRNKIVTAIDVGTTKVCTIVARPDASEGMQVLGVGITPSRGLHKGMVVNVNEAKESIRESIQRAQQSSGMPIFPQSQIRIVFPEQQPIFGPGGKHPVWLFGAQRN